MEKKIVKIVLTGGPCGGKSTGLARIEEEISKLGYRVITIAETATEVFTSGLDLKEYNNDSYLFQANIFKLQYMKEKIYMQACQNLPDDKILLVCDRGIIDGAAYIQKEEFDKILSEAGEDFISMRDNYDGIFHLVTCAKGAPEYYTTANNKARRESLEEAIETDDRVIEKWVGHPHFRVIDNSTSFEEKINRLIKEICALLGEPQPLEIERKFLIKKPDINFLESLPNCKKVSIVQTYLISKEGEECRVRQRGMDGSYVYTLTTKKSITGLKRIEIEEKISEKKYLYYLNNADTRLKQIRKDRFCLLYEGHYFEIDIYPFVKNHAIMEIELSSENEKFVTPHFIDVVREVTGEKEFSNRALAEKIPTELD